MLAGVSDDPRIAQIQLQLLTGELTPEQALAATMAAYQEWLDANPATVPIEGDSEGAESEARGFRRAAGRDPAVVPIDGDGKQARDELSSIEDGDYQATINANLLQQVIAGKFISEFLDWAARPRTVQIGVEVTGLQAANQLLDNVARDRTSTIVVDANTWALSRDIATAISNAVRLGRIAS